MNFFHLLLFVFIITPIFEIYLFITIGTLIGIWPTLQLIILTAIIGTYLLRIQGLTTLRKIQTILAQGQIPTEALLEGIFLLIGGILLLTPGFFTDTIGFGCLLPLSRKYLVHRCCQYIQTTYSPSSSSTRQPSTLEGEYRQENKDTI